MWVARHFVLWPGAQGKPAQPEDYEYHETGRFHTAASRSSERALLAFTDHREQYLRSFSRRIAISDDQRFQLRATHARSSCMDHCPALST
jgi:hypothetical protein